MLELTNISRNFGGLHALTTVNMIVPPNKIIGLIGPNGAGKTTLINNISGLDHPTSGHITFEGRDLSRLPPHRITALGIARTYQNIRLFGDMTALDNLLIGQHARGKATILEALTFMPRYRREENKLVEHALALLDDFGLASVARTRAGTLAYGDQRRLEMARALATQPKMLLLDEPTAGMNAVETHALGEQILRMKALGLSVLVIEHDMLLIQQVCEEIYVLNFGQIIAHGTHDVIKHDPHVIEAYLGEDS